MKLLQLKVIVGQIALMDLLAKEIHVELPNLTPLPLVRVIDKRLKFPLFMRMSDKHPHGREMRP